MSPATRHNISSFLREVWKHGVNGYSAASLVLALIALLPVWPEMWPRYFGIAAIVAVGFYAAFAAWRQAVMDLPFRQGLSIEATTAIFAAAFDSALPPSPARFDIRLDVTNPALEPLDWISVELASWEVSAPLLGGEPVAKPFGSPKNHWGPLTLPFRFESHERRRDLAVFVELAYAIQGADDFARKLRGSNTWSMTLRFVAENSARVRSSTDLQLRGDFSDTKKVALAKWKQEGRADLVAILGGLS